MKKLYIILSLIFLTFFSTNTVKAQCTVDSIANGFWGFNDPAGGIYTGYLCGLIDSVGTFGSQGYYDGDGYLINLVAGSNVTFEVDQCSGNPVSLTVLDSANNIIPGVYSAASCPNSLSFVPTYTGLYVVAMNLNGVCGGGGTSLIGYVHAKITRGTTVPPCPPEGYQINDTICGATTLVLDDPYVNGNTSLSYPTDPMDGSLVDSGFVCSEPNNTMWYTYTPTSNMDTLYVSLATTPGSAFYSWLGVFTAASNTDPCTGGLNYVDCLEGFDDFSGLDTVTYSLLNVQAGTIYYFMIDGYQGQQGDFSIRVQSTLLINTLNELKEKHITVFPNPASTEINVRIGEATMNDALISVVNLTGEKVFEKRYISLQNEKIYVADWAPGIYTVRLLGNNESRMTKVIISR